MHELSIARTEHGLLSPTDAYQLPLMPGLNVFRGRFETVCVGFGDEAKLGAARIIRGPPRFCTRPGEVGPELFGLASGFCTAVRRCMCGAHNALCNRHGTKQPKTSKDFSVFYEFLDDIGPEVESHYVNSYDHWENHWILKWALGKRLAIERDLDSCPFLPSEVASFVKFELYTKIMTKARLIQANKNYVAQAVAGPECVALQKAYTKVLQRCAKKRDICVTFASGMNSLELGRWMERVLRDRPFCRFYERDGKSWDATMQWIHHRLKMYAYRFATGTFQHIVDKGYKVLGHVDMGRGRDFVSYMKYELTGTTKSGHNDTTLGNSIINAGIAYEVMHSMGLTGDIIVAGDDLLVAVDGDFDADEFAERERAFGIIPEFRKFSSYKSVSFISGLWVPRDSSGALVFIPKPGRQFAKLFWSVKRLRPVEVDNYVHSIAECLTPVCGGLPVLGAFIAAHDRKGVIVPLEGKYYLYRGVPPIEYDTGVILDYFCDRYDTNAAEIAELEAEFKLYSGRTGILVHPLFQRMTEIDMCEIDERVDQL